MYIYITHTYSRVQNKVSITILLHDRSMMFTVSIPFPVFNHVFAAQQKHGETMFEKQQTPFQFFWCHRCDSSAMRHINN